MTDTCIVSGPLIDPTGALAPNTKVVIRAGGVVGQYGKTVLPKEIAAISDGSGVLSVPLMPGLYTGLVADTGRTWQFPISVPEAETAALADCVKPAAPPITPGDVVLSQAARDAAQAARLAAELAETNAETAETNAETAQAAAENARDTAQGHAATATTQAGIATTQAGLASTARTGAETARTGAETARTGAETAQTGAQTARTAAETAQTGAQTARTGAEAARDIALGAQAAAQLAAAAITPMDVLHLISQGSYIFPVPSGWWDTGLRQTATDSLRGTTSTMAIISNWNAETLRGAGPNVFVLAHDTARIFGADGVTAVSAPGTAVALAADDWQGLTLGAELSGDPSYDSASGWTLGSGWAVTGGQAIKTPGASNAITRPVSLVAGRAYAVEIDIASVTGTLTLGFFGGSNLFVGTLVSPGVYRIVMVAQTGNNAAGVTVPNGTSGGAVNSLSVREVLNWPAFQNNPAARPLWGRAPAQVRNVLTNSDLAGAVAGTPGTPPTGWTIGGNTGQIVSVAADGLQGGNSVRLSATAGRQMLERVGVPVQPSTTYEFTVSAEVYASAQVQQFVTAINLPAGASISAYRIDGISVSASATVSVGLRTLTVVISVGTTAGTLGVRAGVGCQNNDTGDIRVWAPRVTTAADAAGAYQRRGPVPTDVTESGVTSFGLLSFDGSDDALLHQLAAGGTVAVALFGCGGSFLIPSITLAAPSVLQLGPLSVLDDGVLVSGCPIGILRAVGTVPWSSRFELVGYAIMKANPSAEEQARAMRYFAAHGARGWLVEGPELVTNGTFDANVNGWGALTSWSNGNATWVAPGVLQTTTVGFQGAGQNISGLVPGAPYRIRATVTGVDSGGGGRLYVGTQNNPGSSPLLNLGPYSVGSGPDHIFVATASAHAIGLSSISDPGTLRWDNVSVRALTSEF